MKVSQEDYLLIKKNIIKKLYSHGAFRKGHLLLERLVHGVPAHLAGYVKDVIKDLIKEGLIVEYNKTKHGVAYQLNIKRLKDIEEIILKDLKDKQENAKM